MVGGIRRSSRHLASTTVADANITLKPSSTDAKSSTSVTENDSQISKRKRTTSASTDQSLIKTGRYSRTQFGQVSCQEKSDQQRLSDTVWDESIGNPQSTSSKLPCELTVKEVIAKGMKIEPKLIGSTGNLELSNNIQNQARDLCVNLDRDVRNNEESSRHHRSRSCDTYFPNLNEIDRKYNQQSQLMRDFEVDMRTDVGYIRSENDTSSESQSSNVDDHIQLRSSETMKPDFQRLSSCSTTDHYLNDTAEQSKTIFTGAQNSLSHDEVLDVSFNYTDAIRHQYHTSSDYIVQKPRRTNYVELNMLIWKYFCECRDQNVQLNGRKLREHALMLAKKLGLHSFKGSEGWLDSFKKRHNIDLRTMTGKPVLYEADADCMQNPNDYSFDKNTGRSIDGVSDLLKLKHNNSMSYLISDNPLRSLDESAMPIVDANQFLMDATDAAVQAAESENSNRIDANQVATAAMGTSQSMNLLQTFCNLKEANFGQLPMSNKSSPNKEVHSSLVTPDPNGTLQALVETCCYRVKQSEVAQAIDTLRAFVVLNDLSLLPLLVELQKGLIAVAMKQKIKQPTDSFASSTINDISVPQNPGDLSETRSDFS